MSSDLDLVRSIYAASEHGDFSSSRWAHPEIEWVSPGGPEPSSRKGLAGMTEGWRDWLTAWEDFRLEAEEYREIDSERVLVLTRFSARGKASGMELGQMQSKAAALFHVRDGKVVKLIT
jgi:ketosteroid isomerase-like protein